MPTPVYVGSAAASSTFASSLSGSFNVGADPVTILAMGVVASGVSAVRMDSITLNPGGTPVVMTGNTDRSLGTELGAAGRFRTFEAIATGLTGTVNFTAQMTTLAGVSDGNGRPGIYFAWYKDVASVSSETSQTGLSVSGSGTVTTSALTSATGQVVVGLILIDGLPGTISGAGATVVNGSGLASDYWTLATSEAGAGSTSLQLTASATTAFLGWLWNLVGAVTTPTLILPTSTAITATSATVGTTTDYATGSLYVVVTTSATQPAIAQIKAGQNHLSTVMPAGQRSTITVGATGVQTDRKSVV